MDTKKIIRAVGSGFAGFLVLLCAEGVFLLALSSSFDLFGGSHIPVLIWFLLTILIPPLVILASALPAIIISGDKKTSLISGIIACIFVVIIFIQPFEESRGVFDVTESLAFITAIGFSMLMSSFQPAKGRKKRMVIILVVWVVFSILGLVIASLSQIGGGLTVLLAWLVLPAIAAHLQSEIDIFSG
ncbi:MAG: hypothetical protein H7Y59_03980 [Anaerolineales bacterium]|nr:hypothetical protein [Anaerolineales bacterium]